MRLVWVYACFFNYQAVLRHQLYQTLSLHSDHNGERFPVDWRMIFVKRFSPQIYNLHICTIQTFRVLKLDLCFKRIVNTY